MFLNGDDKLLRSLNYELKDIKKIWYGTYDYCDYRAQNIYLLKNGTTFECLMHNVCKKVFIPMYGQNMALNAVAALAVAHNLNVDLDCAIEALTNFQAPSGRMQISCENTVTLISDIN